MLTSVWKYFLFLLNRVENLIRHKVPGRELRKSIDLNNTINQLDLTDIYRTLHPTTAEYTLFSSAQYPDRPYSEPNQLSVNLKELKSWKVWYPF